MRTLFPTLGLGTLSGLFGITRQAVYFNYKSSYQRLAKRQIVLEFVRVVRQTHPRIGTRKLYHIILPELRERGIKYGRDKLFKLLRDNDLLVRRRKKRFSTTQSNHPFRKYQNLIASFQPYKSNQLWVSDITYLKAKDVNSYLFLLTDAFSRKICGYKLSTNMEAKNAVECLKMAIEAAGDIQGMIHHSDRGIQYCSYEYVKLLQDNQIRISMTQDGNPIDNCIAERVNGILKQEYLFSNRDMDYSELIDKVDESIIRYNNLRPHLSCNMMTPSQAHKHKGILKRKWKNYYNYIK